MAHENARSTAWQLPRQALTFPTPIAHKTEGARVIRTNERVGKIGFQTIAIGMP